MEQKSEGRADSFVQAGTSLLVYRQILEPLGLGPLVSRSFTSGPLFLKPSDSY